MVPIPVDVNKRLYYQYLGFLNTSGLFLNTFYGLEQFGFPKESIPSFEEFTLTITQQLPLGKRVECFFEYFINNSSEFNIIKKNTQIIHNKLTLGELDYILEHNTSKKLYHVELIYKYYLYKTDVKSEIQRYIGPNADDSLEERIAKIRNRQLPLLFKEETKRYFKGIDTQSIIQKVCFKANIFLPLNTKDINFTDISDSCIKGFYINFKDFILDKKYKSYLYYFPQKQDWLIDVKYCQHWFTHTQILEHIKPMVTLKKAPLLWLKHNNEYKTFFLVY